MKYQFSLLSFFAVMACNPVGPDYVTPDIIIPANFVAADGSALVNAAEVTWWTRLNDPLLNGLVARGTAQNLDVAVAVERIRAANAALGRTGLNTQFNGSITAAAERTGFNDVRDNRGVVQADAQFVIDLFGGVRRGREQALANFDAAQLDVGTARLAFLAELTSAYVQARFFQNSAAITRDTIQSRRTTLRIVNERSLLGEATKLEEQQAKSLLATAQAALPTQNANFEVSVFRIATLLNEPAAPILDRMKKGAPQPRPTGIITVGIPADLLRNRPDVRAAERNLAAAVAAIGVTDAQLLPSVSLQGTIGTGDGDEWTFGPALNIPVFNRGILRANKGVAESQARQVELAWRNTILVAMEEVQSALTLSRNWYRQVQFAQRAADSSAQLVRLSRESYDAGAATLDDLLDAQRQDTANQLAAAESVRNYTLSWLQLQVATGQGWRVNLAPGSPEVGAPQSVDRDPAGLSAPPVFVVGIPN